MSAVTNNVPSFPINKYFELDRVVRGIVFRGKTCQDAQIQRLGETIKKGSKAMAKVTMEGMGRGLEKRELDQIKEKVMYSLLASYAVDMLTIHVAQKLDVGEQIDRNRLGKNIKRILEPRGSVTVWRKLATKAEKSFSATEVSSAIKYRSCKFAVEWYMVLKTVITDHVLAAMRFEFDRLPNSDVPLDLTDDTSTTRIFQCVECIIRSIVTSRLYGFFFTDSIETSTPTTTTPVPTVQIDKVRKNGTRISTGVTIKH